MSQTLSDEVLSAGDTSPDGHSQWRTIRARLAWCGSFAALSAVVSSGLLVGVLCAGRWIAYVRVQ